MIEFTVPGNPTALKRHRNFQKGTFRGTYDPSQVDKADFLAKAMACRPGKLLDGPLAVTIEFVFSRPKGHYRTGKYSDVLKDSSPSWHTSTPDADNLAKFIGDALQGMFWKNDSSISQLSVTKHYGEEPYTVIQISELSEESDE